MKEIKYKIIKFFVKIIGFFCFYPNKKMDAQEREFFYGQDLTGCAILSRTDFCLSNLGIKGKYKHSGIINRNEVIEATTSGVHRTPIDTFLHDKSHYVVLYKKFSNPDMALMAVNFAEKAIGLDYDFIFEHNDEKFYCSELVHDSFKHADKGFNLSPGKVIEPMELYNKNYFTILLERKR